jgi:sarcosine oxidase, subunit gamma
MSDYRITLRPALGAKLPLLSPGINLQPLPEGHIIQVLADPLHGDISAQLAQIAAQAAHSVRAAAPGQWFLVGDDALPHATLAQLFDKLRPHAGVDQSNGRVRMLAQGPMVERVLSKGTAVDLSLEKFPIGYSTTTLIGHIAAHVTRVGANGFEIMVLRGFAESLWDDLARMSAEFA